MKCLKTIFLIVLAVFLYGCKKDKVETKNQEPTVAKDTIIELSTSFGNMYIYLYKATPLHRTNIIKLAKEGFYDGTTFHRNILNFMIQGGDPNSKDNDSLNDGSGGPGYTIPNEIRDSIKHDRGCLAAARLGDNLNPERESSGSQFYICLSKSGTAHLNNLYTVYGYVMKGMEVADAIVRQKKDANDRPLTDIKMQMKIILKTTEEIKTEYNYTPKY